MTSGKAVNITLVTTPQFTIHSIRAKKRIKNSSARLIF